MVKKEIYQRKTGTGVKNRPDIGKTAGLFGTGYIRMACQQTGFFGILGKRIPEMKENTDREENL